MYKKQNSKKRKTGAVFVNTVVCHYEKTAPHHPGGAGSDPAST